MKNIFLFILMVFASGVCAQTQQMQDQINHMIPKPVPTSPNVAAIGKFGDYKVGLFTGIPEISIPIFEAKSGEISVPVSLNYHASGFKPTEIPGWVGLGWSISAGGQVSRNVNGKPDEEHYYAHALVPIPSVCNTFTYLEHSASNVSDTEPDVFSYSYPGRSGKFLLPNGTAPYLVPYAPIIVNPNYTPYTFPKFEIKEENGVMYQYGIGTKGTAKEFTTATNGGNPTLTATTAWHLMEIIAPNSDDQISFEYQDAGTAYYHDFVDHEQIIDQCETPNGATCPPEPGYRRSNLDSWVNQKGLKTIFFETGKIEFVLGGLRTDADELYSLDRIEIYSKVKGVYRKQKTIKFNYSYFYKAQTNDPGGLRLDAVEFCDSGGAAIQKYKFTYTTEHLSWNPGSDAFLAMRDWWGYCNLSNAGSLLLKKTISWQPTTNTLPMDRIIGQAPHRDVNPEHVKRAVLSRIDFPTGGYTAFEFEPNKYLDNQTPRLAGGLRVTRITNYDGEGKTTIKTYRYGEGESGYGVANFRASEANYSSEQYFYTGCIDVSPIYSYRSRTYHSISGFSQDPFDSSPVVYTHVTEYIGNPIEGTLGKTVYEFRNATDVNQVIPTSGKFYKDSHFWKRGQLRHKTIYDKDNNKLAETDIVYSEFQPTSRVIGLGVAQRLTGSLGTCTGSNLCTNEVGDIVNAQTFMYSTYSQNSGALLEAQVTDYTYEQGDVNKYVMNQVINTYDPVKLQLTQSIKNRNYSSEQLVTINKYPFQLAGNVNSSSTGTAKGIYMLNTKNILTTPLETYAYLQRADGANQRIVSGLVKTFRQNESNSNFVVADTIFLWQSSVPWPKDQYMTVGVNASNSGITKDARYRSRAFIAGYDEDGNVKEVKKVDDASLCYKWAYENSLPIAEIKNASFKNVFYTSFEEATTGFVSEGKTGNQSSSGFSQMLTNLDPGDYVLSYYKKMGTTWEPNKVSVAVPVSGQYQISISGQVDEVRFYPFGAQMTTYTYDPVQGMTSMTDENNFVTYFNYDDFARLKAVKDNDGNVVKSYKYNYKNQN